MRVSFGEYQLDTETRTLQREGRRIPVQSKAFDLLAYLIERRERVVSSDELLDALWPGLHVTPAALSTAIQKARQAVGDDGEHQTVLHTEHGKGFRFVAEVTDLSEPETVVPPTLKYAPIRLAAVAGIAAVLLVAAVAWFLNQQSTELTPPRSVAVLPFANMSQDAAAEPFTNGIYDDILTQISKIRDLKVIARTTMERLDPNLGIQEIGTVLRVAAVLEGGVQRAGDRVRINVQLNDCETEAHLWAETYDRELTTTNIFAIQSEIATAVADALQAEISPEEQDRIATVPTENLAAYEAYLLGKQRLARESSASLQEAIDYFQQAVELDPNYALAYVGLADSHSLRVEWGMAPRDAGLAKAQAAADKALELNDRLGEAYNSLAGIKHTRGDFEGAEAAYQHALELNPSYGTTYVWYGSLLTGELSRHEEALSLLLKGAELDPLSARPLLNVGIALERLGRVEEALTWYERAHELDPMLDAVVQMIGHYHWSVTGKLDQAVAWHRRAISLDPGFHVYQATLGLIFLDLGDPVKAEYWFERAIKIGPAWPDGKIGMMFVHLYRGEEPAAVNQARINLADFPSGGSPLMLLRNHELRAGRYAEARALYEKFYPTLLIDDDPQVGRTKSGGLVDFALVLFKTGETKRAEELLNRHLQYYIQTKPRIRAPYIAQILALQGKKQKALSVLRQGIDEGWRDWWWYVFKHEPNLESLHDNPEYQAMVAEIEADMAAQLERVREMERNGELEPIPEIPATTQ